MAEEVDLMMEVIIPQANQKKNAMGVHLPRLDGKRFGCPSFRRKVIELAEKPLQSANTRRFFE